jgi:hypothetical protein
VKDHVLLPQATELEAADKICRSLLNGELIRSIVALIPENWLAESPFVSADEHRAAYAEFLETRLAHSDIFVKHAQDARAALI